MKVQYLALCAIISALGIGIVSSSHANGVGRLISSEHPLLTADTKPLNPYAAKPNPCASNAKALTTRHPRFYTENGVALDGQDVVAYFTQNQLVEGSRTFTYRWGDTVWLFSSAKHRDLFAANPLKYAPQYGGYCAKAASEGNLVATQPDAWKIVDGKLYLNYDKAVQAQWMKDIPGNIAAANKYWPGILNNQELFR
jgi:hypothetical protein